MGPARHCQRHPIIKVGHYYFSQEFWYNHDINRRGRRVNKPWIEKTSTEALKSSESGPRRRILRFEKFFDIKNGSALGGSSTFRVSR
jgi:hypothetical protein